MIIENTEKTSGSHGFNRLLPWFNLTLAIILIGLGIWYLSGKVTLDEIIQALLLADPWFILLGLALTLVTILLKAWRWQLMFKTPDESLSFSPAFWALMLGQYVNLIVPFFRLGEIARIYALNRQADIKMARSLGTLVLEKVLDMFMLMLAIALVLPLVILPEFVNEPGLLVWILPIVALIMLYLMSYQTKMITTFFSALESKIPTRFAKRLLKWSISGLEGLSSLRSKQLSLLLVGSSALIIFMSILLPFVMFAAFHLPLGLIEAAVIHIVVTIATTPPSTPGKIGVFNGAVALILLSFGLTNEAVVISYSIVFLLVVIVPQIAFGSIAAARTDWRWQKAKEQQLAL
jgi:glycosyltransferase 2 family protein